MKDIYKMPLKQALDMELTYQYNKKAFDNDNSLYIRQDLMEKR